jgi:MOSC domain-containing protein YiiM
MPAVIAALHRSNGGVPKLAVDEVTVTVNGVAGDRQRDRRFHGGRDRALCLYSLDLIERLCLDGHPMAPGAMGENVTIAGLDWRQLRPGVCVELGAVVAEVTSYAAPCKNIRGAFLDDDFTRVSQKLHPGWSRVYARVLVEGMVRVGDAAAIRILENATR